MLESNAVIVFTTFTRYVTLELSFSEETSKMKQRWDAETTCTVITVSPLYTHFNTLLHCIILHFIIFLGL